LSAAAKLHERLRDLRARAAIRKWEIRQRRHAAGSWFTLERLFASARQAWVLTEDHIGALAAAGYEPHPVGLGFEPPRTIFVIREGDTGLLTGARDLALRVSPDLLLAQAVALLPFPPASSTDAGSV
jgi:hypothetical protein